MPNVRIQLHSTGGRLQLLVAKFAFWPALLCCSAAVVVVATTSHDLRPAILLGPAFSVPPLFALWVWAARNSTSVFATPQGLELPGRRKTVAWPAVVEAHPVKIPSPIPIYRVTFSDGTAPLTFYTWQRLEQVIARFKSPTNIDD